MGTALTDQGFSIPVVDVITGSKKLGILGREVHLEVLLDEPVEELDPIPFGDVHH